MNTEDPDVLAERMRIMHAPRIFKYVSGRALGDVWTLTQWLARRSEETGQPAVLSRQLGPQPDGHDNVLDLIPRCLALLDTTGTIEFTDEEGVDPPITGPSLWGPRVVYMPTRNRWLPWPGMSLAYQFDGRSGSDAKNPSAVEAERILHAWPVDNIGTCPPVRIGLPMTVEEEIAALAGSRLFIGVCSGISHLAHSVGVPMILIRYRLRFERWHPDPTGPCPWTLAEGTDDAIAKLQERLA